MDAGLGRPDLDAQGVEEMREVIVSSGAVDAVEAEIARLADAARLSLKSTSGVAGEALDVLDALIDFSTARSA
jgi:geranylgeranyl diphosphate synthase type I